MALQARHAIETGAFKEAIEGYKALLKLERRGEWLDGLAAAYAGRAEQLAAKSMFKEALVLWRNRAELCGKPLYEGGYLNWLLAADDLVGVMRLYLAARAGTLPEVDLPELEALLAPRLLTLSDSQLQVFPADDPLRLARSAALAVITALGRGDLDGAEMAAKQVSLRSPYRDLRPLLRALALIQTEPDEAARLLARLPENGLFARLQTALQVALKPSPDWLLAARELPDHDRQLILDIKGCPEAWRPYLLGVAGALSKPETHYDLLQKYRRALPEGMTAALGLRLLPHVPNKLDDYTRSLGSIAQFDRMRMLALEAEIANKFSVALRHWNSAAKELRASENPVDRLKVAQINWHLLKKYVDETEDGRDLDPIDLLLDIVEMDPDDRAAYCDVLRRLREKNDLKRARTYLDTALSRFAVNADVLLEAVAIALAGNAFKKATTYASRLLVLDPINPRVRGMLAGAGLAQARKQIKAKRIDLARKELETACEWVSETADKAALALLNRVVEQGLDWAPASAADGQALLEQAGGGLVGRYYLLYEGALLNIPNKTMIKWPGMAFDVIRTSEVRELIKVLKTAAANDKSVLMALLAFEPVFETCLTYHTRDQMAEICELMHRLQSGALLRMHIKAALTHWNHDPLFVFLDVHSTYGERPKKIPEKHLYRLDQAWEMAGDMGNHQLANRISAYLEQVPNAGPFAEFGGGLNGVGALAEDMEQRLAASLMAKLIGRERFIEEMKRYLGREAIREFERNLGPNAHPNAMYEFLIEELVVLQKRGLPPPPFVLDLFGYVGLGEK